MAKMAESLHDDGIEDLRDQDRFLPIANINRIVKRRLPYNAKVAKDAKETTQVRRRLPFDSKVPCTSECRCLSMQLTLFAVMLRPFQARRKKSV